MTLREKIGQRFVVGFPGTVLEEDFIRLLEEYKIGNIILFQENIVNREQLKALCGQLQDIVRKSTGHGAFITIDQEGGAIVRLTEDAVNVPGAMAIAATGEPGNARLAGRLTGEELHALGINFDLAPDMDINCNPQNSVIGVRSYADTPGQVSRYAMEMAAGLAEGQVLACAKHFPGHGDTATDSHIGLPLIDKTREELQQMELVPFREAVRQNIPAIMTTHILFPALEPEKLPATMSKRIVTGLLRREMGFEGLVLSDCMEMGAIKEYYGTVEGCLAALRAGVDMVFVSHHAELAAQAVRRVEEAVQSGEFEESEMDESVARILSFKHKYADDFEPEGESGREENRAQAYELLKKTVTLVNCPSQKPPYPGKNPFFAGCHAYRVNLAGNVENTSISFAEKMVEQLGGSGLLTKPDPTEEEIRRAVELADGHSAIIFGTYNGHLKQGQMRLQRALADKARRMSVPMVAVALRNPFDLCGLPPHVTGIALWEYSERSLRALAEALESVYRPEGKMPVKMPEKPEGE